MPGARDKGTEGWGVGVYREGSKEEVKEMAGAERRKGGRVQTLALPRSQERCGVRRALLHLCHVVIDQCVSVYMSK